METKKYWFSLKSHVYAEFKNETMLLYDTQTGKTLEVVAKDAISLVIQMREPEKLGVILYDEELHMNSNVHTFVQNVIDLKLGDLWKYEAGRQKPIRLFPILNLQRDVDRLKEGGGNELLLGKDIINYLLELNIYLNYDCDKSCVYCNDYCKQVHCCTNNHTGAELPVENFQKIFDQIKYSSVGKVNLFGGNIFKYENFTKIYDFLELMKDVVYCFIHYENFEKNELIDSLHLELIVNFPVNENSFENTWLQINRENTTVRFILENEEQYFKTEELIRKFDIEKYEIHPFYSGKNMDFFTDNIFVRKEDILSNTLQMREIFRNQKLNSNFFGVLYILPDGTVKANMNTSALGNIKNTTILNMIYKEMIDNTVWRKIRDAQPCSECIYQFICPAPSNYETAIGRSNLCHVKQTE